MFSFFYENIPRTSSFLQHTKFAKLHIRKSRSVYRIYLQVHSFPVPVFLSAIYLLSFIFFFPSKICVSTSPFLSFVYATIGFAYSRINPFYPSHLLEFPYLLSLFNVDASELDSREFIDRLHPPTTDSEMEGRRGIPKDSVSQFQGATNIDRRVHRISFLV